MLPSSPMAPFTPAILAHLPEPEPEPRSDEPVAPDANPFAPLAPVGVGVQGKCCGDTGDGDGGGEGFTGDFTIYSGGLTGTAIVENGLVTDVVFSVRAGQT